MAIYHKASYNIMQDAEICKIRKQVSEIVQDKHYKHVQVTPSSNWLINHELEKIPSMWILDNNGCKIHGKVVLPLTLPDKINILSIQFSQPVTGEVYLN